MLRLVQYSEKSIAIFGNTKPIKDQLKELGGKFNNFLKEQNESNEPITSAGWIFPNKNKSELLKLIETANKSPSVFDSDSENVMVEKVEKVEKKEEKEPYVSKALSQQDCFYENKEQQIKMIYYSEKSIGIFGEGTKNNKEKLVELGACFNGSLNVNGTKTPGFICPLKNKDKCLHLFQ